MLLASILLTGLNQTGSSQGCNPIVSPVYPKITTNQSINATGTGYWICDGLTVNILSSTGSMYLLEQNVTLNIIDSDGDLVYAKNGCVINNSSAEDIGVIANPSTVTLNNTGSGTLTIVTVCTTLAYDYSSVGGNTCIAGGIMENANLISVDLFPNPVVSSFTLSINNDKNFKQFTFVLYNVLGEEVKRVENITQDEIEISRGKLQSGIYMYQLQNENTIVNTGKLIIQ